MEQIKRRKTPNEYTPHIRSKVEENNQKKTNFSFWELFCTEMKKTKASVTQSTVETDWKQIVTEKNKKQSQWELNPPLSTWFSQKEKKNGRRRKGKTPDLHPSAQNSPNSSKNSRLKENTRVSNQFALIYQAYMKCKWIFFSSKKKNRRSLNNTLRIQKALPDRIVYR